MNPYLAVILNEHLIEALRRLKKESGENNVDRRLVTNVLISFFNTPRADSKRFEMLSLLASILGWSDEDRERAGLQRLGTSASSSGSGAQPSSSRPNISMGSSRRRAMSRATSAFAKRPQAGDESFVPDGEMGMEQSFSNLWVEYLRMSDPHSSFFPSVFHRDLQLTHHRRPCAGLMLYSPRGASREPSCQRCRPFTYIGHLTLTVQLGDIPSAAECSTTSIWITHNLAEQHQQQGNLAFCRARSPSKSDKIKWQHDSIICPRYNQEPSFFFFYFLNGHLENPIRYGKQRSALYLLSEGR